MKVFSQLINAQIENRTADPSAGTRGRFWMRTDTSPVVFKADDGTSIRTIVTTDNTQTLTNKTLTAPAVTVMTGTVSGSFDFDGGTASDTARITVPKAATATINALARKQGTIVYDSSTDKLYKDNGASLVELAAASGVAVATKTANYTLTVSDNVILTNAGGDVTMTLPAASTVSGSVFYIKKIDPNLNKVTIKPNGSETIDGQTTILLIERYQSVQIVSNGTTWYIL